MKRDRRFLKVACGSKLTGAMLLCFWCLALLLASPCFAEKAEVSGEPIFAAKHQMTTAKFKIDIASKEPLDLPTLLSDIDETDSMEALANKVNTLRKKLYPGQEVKLEITNLSPEPKRDCAYIGLLKAIYWWDNYNPYNNYWYAKYTSGAGACFIEVLSGSYALYTAKGRGWQYQFTSSAGAGLTQFGYPGKKGFKGVGKTGYNVADIVIYFYY